MSDIPEEPEPSTIAWISVHPEDLRARVKLASVYAGLGLPPSGAGLDHVLRIHAQMPETLTEHLEFYRGILRRKGPLSRVECEVIGVAVSVRNRCHY